MKLKTVGLLVASVWLLTGCGSKELDDLKVAKEYLDIEVAELKDKNAELQGLVDYHNISSNGNKGTSIQVIDGEIPKFKLLDGKLVMPTPFNIDMAKADTNKSYALVGSVYKFAPSTSWLLNMSGATLNMYHPNNISGQIKAFQLKDSIPVSQRGEILKGYVGDLPTLSKTYRKLYFDDNEVGELAQMVIDVDGKEAPYYVGYVLRGTNGYTFMFLGQNGDVTTQQELIEVVLSSSYVGGTYIRIE